MEPIHIVVRQAARRLFVTHLLRTLTLVAAAALLALAITRITQKVGVGELPWLWLFLGASGLTLTIALLWSLLRRKDELSVARELDERAGLNESLSTALCVGASGDGWSRNVVDDASHRAKRVVVRDAVPIEGPRAWPLVLGGLALLLAVWWIPALPGSDDSTISEDDRRELVEVQAQVEANEDRLNELLEQAGIESFDEGGDDASEADEPLDPDAPLRAEDVRRAQIKKLTNIAEQLEKLTESPQANESKALEDAMRRLTDPGPGPMSEMGRSLAQGNFGEAKDQLNKLAEQLADGGLTPEQAGQAKEQLEQLSAQLDQLAKSRQQLEEQLREAGLSQQQAQQLAQNPDQLQKALEENQSLSESQKQALQQAAQAQQQASDAMSSMAQSMGQMAQGMQQQGMSQQGQQALDQLQSQLGQMEMSQSDLASAQAAMSEAQRQLAECASGLCENPGGMGQGFGEGNKWGNTGEWRQGNAFNQGTGSGGPGQGNGAGPDAQQADYALEDRKSTVNTGEGPVIASTLVYGSQIRGESRAQFAAAASAGKAEAASAIETRRIPREYEGAVAHYFGRLERVAGSGESSASESGSGTDSSGNGTPDE